MVSRARRPILRTILRESSGVVKGRKGRVEGKGEDGVREDKKRWREEELAEV